MLKMVLRRMFSNFWMVMCLLLGSILATALVSCIPLYTEGILQRMLIKDLENYQHETGKFPGQYTVKAKLNYNYRIDERTKVWRYFDKQIMTQKIPEFELPVITAFQSVRFGSLSVPIDKTSGPSNKANTMYAQLGALSGMEEHITITNGRMYSTEPVDGVYEAIVNQSAMKMMDLLLDGVYKITDPSKGYSEVARVKVVGVFEPKDPGDVYWHHGMGEHQKELLMDYQLINRDFLSVDDSPITEATWKCYFDYHSISLQNLSRIVNTCESQKKWFTKYRGTITFDMPVAAIISNYNERAKQLQNMLLVLTVPVLIMLVFYIFMVSQLIIRHDENGIAVLKSRGAGNGQIFLGYLIESSLIAAVALIAGPILGVLICNLIGSSNGFLEFVQRTALPIRLSTKVFAYSSGSVVFLILTMLAPVIAASRTSIVKHKQGKSRMRSAPIWKKFFIDILLLLVSAYGLYRYKQQQSVLETTGIGAGELQIDPLLFLTTTIFILGAGLLFIRIYPYLIQCIYWAGKKIWSPVMYSSLIQVGRSRGQEQFLMLFIILAMSTGLFNANSARTINKNIEDKISYSIGADVRMMAVWKDNQPPPLSGPPMQQQTERVKIPLQYYEPDYYDFATLSGTKHATKVLNVKNGTMQTAAEWAKNVNIMGIIPDEFAKVAWFRPDLLPYHWYNYLNLMSDAPRAFLVSSNMKKKYDLTEGDTIHITWGDQSYLEGVIYAFIDYWPAYNPNPPKAGTDAPGLVVANLSYIQSKLALQPYEVWINKAEDITDKQINDDIIEKDLDILSIRYTDQEVIKMKNDSMLQGMNGMLTLGFIAAMLISMLGFLIYWIISIQERTLQFGILRAMGFSMTRVIGMLACEQVLVSGTAILLGIIIGGVTGDLFIPLFQIVYSSADQVPPFKIMASGDDYLKVYGVIGTMLMMGFLMLWRIMSKIRIDQAVKLGED